MRASTALSVLALVGSSLAAPAPEYVENVQVVWETVIHTVTATEGGYTAPTAAPEPAKPAYSAQPPAQPEYNPPSQPEYNPPPKPEAPKVTISQLLPKPTLPAKPQPPPTKTQEYVPPQETGSVPEEAVTYMNVIHEWRAKMGMPPIEYSETLERNARKCGEFGNGQMKHNLFTGTNGQVLAPGEPGKDGFEKVYVGGWLCEMPGMSGLNGICGEMSQGWDYEGQTGHAEILTKTDYKSVGCALVKGIWACDFGNNSPEELLKPKWQDTYSYHL